MLVWPTLADPIYTDREVPGSRLDWWLVHTPLRALWAGEEAVSVFFVLSGVVLALAAQRAGFSWRAYYPSRLVRLYLPVWVSLVLAVGWYLLLPEDPVPGAGTWLNAHVDSLTARNLLGDLLLVGGTSTLNGPLWSLRWEVLFSLGLPLYLLAGRRWPRLWPLVLALTVLTMAVGAVTGRGWLFYLPVFALGILVAVHLDSLRALAQRIERRPRPGLVWGSLFSVSLVVLVVRWLAIAVDAPPLVLHALYVLSPLSATVLVVLAALWPAAVRLLTTRTAAWLGTVSFSLYLVHEPLVVALAFLLDDGPLVLVGLLALPLSLGYGWLFYRWVERPSHRLANRVGAGRPRRPSEEAI